LFWRLQHLTASSPELWGDSSLFFWHSNNRGRPTFGLLFVGKGQLVVIAAPAQTAHAGAEQQLKPTQVHTVHSGARPGTLLWPYLRISTKGRELCYSLLYSNEIATLLVGQHLGSPAAESWAEPHCLGNPTTGRSWCLHGTLIWPKTHQPAQEEATYAVKLIF